MKPHSFSLLPACSIARPGTASALALALALSVFGPGPAQAAEPPPPEKGPAKTAPAKAKGPAAVASAVALLKPTDTTATPRPKGTVTFTKVKGGVRVFALLTGVPAGAHGFHVHMRGDCRGKGDSALGHFNPAGHAHGLPGKPPTHVGDLGNLTADSAGRAVLDQVFPGLVLEGKNSIVGRGLILHANPDDGSQPTGNAGARIACAEILPPRDTATAMMEPTAGNAARGWVKFTETPEGLDVWVRIGSASLGAHGFHIHEFGDCSAPDALSAGGHFNPEGAAHGLPGADTAHAAAPMHIGDLGNLPVNARGDGRMRKVFPHLSLRGPYSILGRSVIVHADRDDGGQPTGNSGARITCGEILP